MTTNTRVTIDEYPDLVYLLINAVHNVFHHKVAAIKKKKKKRAVTLSDMSLFIGFHRQKYWVYR